MLDPMTSGASRCGSCIDHVRSLPDLGPTGSELRRGTRSGRKTWYPARRPATKDARIADPEVDKTNQRFKRYGRADRSPRRHARELTPLDCRLAYGQMRKCAIGQPRSGIKVSLRAPLLIRHSEFECPPLSLPCGSGGGQGWRIDSTESDSLRINRPGAWATIGVRHRLGVGKGRSSAF